MKKYIWKHPVLFIWAIIATCLSDLLWLGIAFSLKNIIDLASMGDLSKLLPELIWAAVLLLVIAFTIFLGHSGRAIYLKKTMIAVKQDVFNNLMGMDMDTFQSENSAKYLSVFNNDLKLFDTNYLYTIIRTVSNLILLPFAAGAMLFIHPGIALLVLVMSAVSLVVPILLGKLLSNRQEANVKAQERYNIRLKDIFTGFEMIQSYGISDKMKKNHSSLAEDTEHNLLRLRFMEGTASCLSYGAGRINYILVIAITAIMVAGGRLSPGTMLASLELMNSVLFPLWNLSEQFASIKAMKSVNERIESLLISRQKNAVHKNELPTTIQTIALRDLSFSYDAQGDPILKNISLVFERGKKYAIVGASGCGKTTLLRLLMRYYDHYDGQILVNGADVKQTEKESYYQKIAMIHQHVFLFDDTIRNNISLYSDYSPAQIQKAIDDAGLGEKLLSLQLGLDSWIEESGRNFSGGERQRFAIARAFLRGTPILILDEATAGLDNHIAHQIDLLLAGKKDLTAIMVTHKLNEAFLRGCDEIIVLKNGIVSEQGDFDTLMKKTGEFYSLYQIAN